MPASKAMEVLIGETDAPMARRASSSVCRRPNAGASSAYTYVANQDRARIVGVSQPRLRFGAVALVPEENVQQYVGIHCGNHLPRMASRYSSVLPPSLNMA